MLTCWMDLCYVPKCMYGNPYMIGTLLQQVTALVYLDLSMQMGAQGSALSHHSICLQSLFLMPCSLFESSVSSSEEHLSLADLLPLCSVKLR